MALEADSSQGQMLAELSLSISRGSPVPLHHQLRQRPFGGQGSALRQREGGAAVELYVRPKIGFCNCDTGVADDDEVDRVADLDLMSERFVPLAPGKVTEIDGMKGRSRPYDLRMSDGSQHTAIGIAVSRHCNLLVAVAHGKGSASGVQREAVEFLGSSDMAHWMTAAIDGG